eukprot:m.5351 g.5351  ORF g.5351 m.5351 type:complete len:483 (+) comp2504_c0_seq1:294-1742(+)
MKSLRRCLPAVEWRWGWPTWFAPPRRDFEYEFNLQPEPTPPPTPQQSEPVASDSRCIQASGSLAVAVLFGIGALVICREYLGQLLAFLSHVGGWRGYALYGSLFVPISFPMMWGYLILNLGAGYLYGVWTGTLVVAVGAAVGSLASFAVCRKMFKNYVLQTLSSYENFRQILRVIEGRQGFKIIMMTRLTPVPFGLQNALFSAAKVSSRKYLAASICGLLPTQLLNSYMGSSLRSMEDVLSGKSSNTMVLVSQVFVAVAVTFFVNQRMKREVHNACEQEARTTREQNLQMFSNLIASQEKPLHAHDHVAASMAADRVHVSHSVYDFQKMLKRPGSSDSMGDLDEEYAGEYEQQPLMAMYSHGHSPSSSPPPLPTAASDSCVVDMGTSHPHLDALGVPLQESAVWQSIGLDGPIAPPATPPPTSPMVVASPSSIERHHRRTMSASAIVSMLSSRPSRSSIRSRGSSTDTIEEIPAPPSPDPRP